MALTGAFVLPSPPSWFTPSSSYPGLSPSRHNCLPAPTRPMGWGDEGRQQRLRVGPALPGYGRRGRNGQTGGSLFRYMPYRRGTGVRV